MPLTTALLIGLFLFIAIAFVWWLLRRPAGLASPFSDTPVQTVEAGGWTIRYHRSGKGPSLLLLHGIGANLFCWRQITPLLARHFTVIAPDLPGFGRSSRLPGAAYGLDDQVSRLLAFLDALKIQQTYVCGNSMGGNIALWMTRLHPGRVLGCAVIAPATSPGLVPLPLKTLALFSHPLSYVLTRQAMGWAHRRTVSKKDLVGTDRIEETFATYGRDPHAVRSFLLATEAIRDRRLPEALSGIRSSVLVLWGSNDKLVSRKVINQLESALGAAESHVHMGGGHHLQEDEPEWVAEKLQDFFLARRD